ncbi:hypothetical protein HanRHA438_Chr17g0819301 [Helianthus annuus]|nr:hypothetical protein HanRHA438_Chr17g0819301 [Helianthus annuus]
MPMVWMLPMSCHMLMALQTISDLDFLTFTEILEITYHVFHNECLNVSQICMNSHQHYVDDFSKTHTYFR